MSRIRAPRGTGWLAASLPGTAQGMTFWRRLPQLLISVEKRMAAGGQRVSAGWKTVRVFISSTFRDMHAERDYLVKLVFPRLREWCAERRLYLVDIDLRWGVTREEAENGKATEICLQEIDECRPFFLCLLGEQYGWVPLDSEGGRSITHSEILHAVLGPNAQQHGQQEAFFYFRDPLSMPKASDLIGYSEQELAAFNASYYSQPSRAGEDPVALLQALKQEVSARYGAEDRVFVYDCDWDASYRAPDTSAVRGRFTNLESLGRRIEADVQRGVQARFASHLATLDRELDPVERERSLHEAFSASRTQLHVPDAAAQTAISEYVDGERRTPCVVLGSAGAGKSAALAYWAERNSPRQPAPATIILFRSIGASPLSSQLHSLLQYILLDLETYCTTINASADSGTEAEASESIPTFPVVPTDPAEVVRTFPALLQAASQLLPGRAVILIDGVNQLGEAVEPGLVNWLPNELPPNIRLVVSVTENSPGGAPASKWLAAIRQRGFLEVRLSRLDDRQSKSIIQQLPSIYAKSLDDRQVAALLSNPASRNPLFLTVALQELRVFGSFSRLDDAIASIPRPSGQDRVDAAIDALFDHVLERLETEIGGAAPELVPQLFGLLASARYGLSEQELLALISRTSSTGAPDEEAAATIQAALRQVRPYLNRKDHAGTLLIGFFHQSFASAAQRKYVADAAQDIAFRRQIAALFEAQPDFVGAPHRANGRKSSELIWQRLRIMDLAADRAGASAELQQSVELLRDWRFLEAKKDCGLIHELVGEMETIASLSGDDSASPVRLSLLTQALRRNIQFVARHHGDYPQAMFQCLWNALWWHDHPSAAGYYANGREHSALFGGAHAAWADRFRAERRAYWPDQSWLRELRPPESRLDSGQRMVFDCYKNPVRNMQYSRDGRFLVTVSSDPAILVWDMDSLKEVYRVPHVGGKVHDVAISPDGRHLAIGLGRRVMGDAVQLRSFSTGELIRSYKVGVTTENGYAKVEFCNNGKAIRVKLTDKAAKTISVATGNRLPNLDLFRPIMRAFANLGPRRQALSKALATARRGHRSPVRTWTLSPDKKTLVTAAGGSEHFNEDDFAVMVWDATAAGGPLLAIDDHKSEVNGSLFSDDGSCLVTTSGMYGAESPTLLFWSLANWRPRPGTEACSDGIKDLFIHDNNLVAAGQYCGTSVWDLDDPAKRHWVNDASAYIKRVAIRPTDGTLWVGGAANAAERLKPKVFDLATGQLKRELFYDAQVVGEPRSGFAFPSPWVFSPDGRFLAGSERHSGYSSYIHIVDPDSLELLAQIDPTRGAVGAIAFDASGDLLAYAGAQEVWVGGWASEGVSRRLSGHSSTVDRLVFSDDGRYLTSASQRETRIWEVSSGRCLQSSAGDGEVLQHGKDPLGAGCWALCNEELLVVDKASSRCVARTAGKWHHLSAHPDEPIWAANSRNHTAAWRLET